jgi:biotin transporter BioY
MRKVFMKKRRNRVIKFFAAVCLYTIIYFLGVLYLYYNSPTPNKTIVWIDSAVVCLLALVILHFPSLLKRLREKRKK